METGRNVFRMGNPDGSGQARVERGQAICPQECGGYPERLHEKPGPEHERRSLSCRNRGYGQGGSKESGKGSFQARPGRYGLPAGFASPGKGVRHMRR